jgi:aerobic carbon-monoxide dehydrogenase small subunit
MTAVDLELSVNGRPLHLQVDPRMLLVQLLRDQLGLTGTHIGCDTAQCGACTVLLDGRAIKSCNLLAVQAQGQSVISIEGLAPADGALHPMQAAFKRHHGLQCGFCTPGMIMSAMELLHTLPDAGVAEVRAALEGNLCRCTGYQGIVAAVTEVLQQARAASPAATNAEP